MDFYKEAFKRNIGLFSEAEQEKLQHSRAAVAGLGGVGGFHLITLARLGIGKFHIADNDTFETVNINRQYGATKDTQGREKTEVMKESTLAINPEADIKTFPVGITEDNIDAFLEGVDVVLDGIDFFAFDARRMLFNKAREKGITAITSGPIGFGSTLQVFTPDSMSFDEYFAITDNMSYIEQMVAFAVGLTPKTLHIKYMDMSKVDLKSGTGPAVASACAICAGLASTEAVNVILKKRPIKAAPHYFQFDPYRQIYKKGCLFMGGRNPIQRLKRKILLKRVGSIIKE